jgi:hypothetical protein
VVLAARALAAAQRRDGEAFRGFEQRAELPGRERPFLALARGAHACREARWSDAVRHLAAVPPEWAGVPPGLAPALRAWCAKHDGRSFEPPEPAALWAGSTRDEVRRVWPELVGFLEEQQRFATGGARKAGGAG